MKQQFVFLHGISVRSGTNLSARIFLRHPDVEVVPENQTLREFPLLHELKKFQGAFEGFAKSYKKRMGKDDQYEWKKYMPYLGESFKNYLLDNLVSDREKQVLFLKVPSVINIESFFDVFPDSKLILLLRNGRDLVSSGEKGYLAQRGSQSIFEKLKRRLAYFLGRPFRGAVKSYQKNLELILSFLESNVNSENIYVIHFEDLASENYQVLQDMFSFCGLDPSKGDFSNIEVVGSSFVGEFEPNQKKIKWQPVPKTESFNPIGRSKDWPKWKHNYFDKKVIKLEEKLNTILKNNA